MTTKTIGTIPAEKLLGMEIDLLTKLRSGALTLYSFEMYLKGQNPFNFPNTIKLGTFKTEGELRAAIQAAGGNVSDYSKDIMPKPEFTLAETEMDVELVITSGADLGFTEAATRKEIYERATSEEFGYMLCPAEVGPQLRLQYLGQPKNEWLLIGMEPITDSDGDLSIFLVERYDDGDLWLYKYYGHAGLQWDPGFRWVFLRPRNSFCFSPQVFWGEFCLESCPFQPPSILPISSICRDRAIYFLLSRDLVSHKIINSIFRVSTFRIANRTYGCFSSFERKLAAAVASIISMNKVSILWPSEWR